MAWRENPLLKRAWLSQFRLKRLHRSGIVYLLILFALEVGAFQYFHHRDLDMMWFVFSMFSMTLIAPISTLLPLRFAWYAVRNLRQSGQLEHLLVTPLSSREFARGLMLPAMLPIPLFYLGFMAILFLHLPMIYKTDAHTQIPNDWTYWFTLLGTIPYCAVQVYYAVTVTLWLSLRAWRGAMSQVQAVIILALAPMVVFGMLLFAISSSVVIMEFEEYLGIEVIFTLVKLAVAVGLTVHLARHFHDIVQIEAS